MEPGVETGLKLGGQNWTGLKTAGFGSGAEAGVVSGFGVRLNLCLSLLRPVRAPSYKTGFFSCAAKRTIENTWRCLIGQCTIESTWRCFGWAMHNRRHVPLFTLVIKSKPRSPKIWRALWCVVWITEDRRSVGLIDFYLRRSKHIQRKAYAFHGTPTPHTKRCRASASKRVFPRTEWNKNVLKGTVSRFCACPSFSASSCKFSVSYWTKWC